MSVTPLSPITAGDIADAFLGRLKREGCAPDTITRYRPILDAFAQWAGERSLGSISATDIDEGFFAQWDKDFEERNGREPKPDTRRAVHGTLSSMYSYAVNFGKLRDEAGHPVANPMLAIKPPKVKRRKNDWLRPAQDEDLLSAPMDELEAILVLFLRWNGLRLSEALALREQDVDVVSRTIYVDDSKSDNGIREVPIPDELVLAIKLWREYKVRRGLPAGVGFFLCTTRSGHWRDLKTGRKCSSAPGQPLKPQQVEKIIRRVGERAGIERLTPHRLRRTYGSVLVNGGARLQSVSKILGHSNTKVTEDSYAQLMNETIRREILDALA